MKYTKGLILFGGRGRRCVLCFWKPWGRPELSIQVE